MRINRDADFLSTIRGGEAKSIRLVVGRFLRGQEVGLPRVYAANVRSICTVVRRGMGRGSFDSTWKCADATIPRADPP